MDEVRQFRQDLTDSVGQCEICGASPSRPCRVMPAMSRLCCHEIANGPSREKALDKHYALLVLCWKCNSTEVVDKSIWPQARQLALLRLRRPDHFDLTSFNTLVNPNAPMRITLEEVDQWISSLST